MLSHITYLKTVGIFVAMTTADIKYLLCNPNRPDRRILTGVRASRRRMATANVRIVINGFYSVVVRRIVIGVVRLLGCFFLQM